MPFIPLQARQDDFPRVSPDEQAARDASAERVVAAEFEQDMPDERRAALERDYRHRFGKTPPVAQRSGFVPLTDDPRRGFTPLGEPDAPPAPGLLKTIAMENPGTALGEAALNLGTQGIALPVAGLAGLGVAAGNALGLTDRKPEDTVHSILDRFTYQPRGEMGKGATAIVMAPFEKLAQAGQGAGNAVLDATGSPALATAVDTGINAVPMLLTPAARKARSTLAEHPTGFTPLTEEVPGAAHPETLASLALDDRALSQPERPQVSELRPEGYPGQPALAGQLPAVSEGRRPGAESPALAGPSGFEPELRAGEYGLADSAIRGAAEEADALHPVERPEIAADPAGEGSRQAPGNDAGNGASGFHPLRDDRGAAADLPGRDPAAERMGEPYAPAATLGPTAPGMVARADAGPASGRRILFKLLADYTDAELSNLHTTLRSDTLRAEVAQEMARRTPPAEQPAMPDTGRVNSFSPGANYTPFIDDTPRPGSAQPGPGTTAPAAAPAKPATRPEPIRREDILIDFARALDTGIYEGRVAGKNVMGFFKPKTEEIRIKRHADLETAAHELAHLLDKRVPEIRKSWSMSGDGWQARRKELQGVSYDSGKLYEGFAEFVRLHMTQPEVARAKAPAYSKWFEDFTRRSEYGPAIKKAAAGMAEWFAQDAVDRARSKIGDHAPLSDALNRNWDSWRQSVVDDLHGVYRMEQDTTGRIAPVGAYESARLARASQSIADGALRFGAPLKKADGSFAWQGKGLEEILRPLGGDLENALLYFVGKSAQELLGQGREHLFTPAEIQGMLKLKTPEAAKAFAEYQKWNAGILDFAEAQGVINPDARALWQRTQYLPFQRVTQGGGFKGKPGDWSGIKALTGGTENIRDVLANMTSNAAQLIDKAVKNEARLKIAELAETAQGGGKFMAKIPAESRPMKVDARQAVDALMKSMGLDANTPVKPFIAKALKQLRKDLEDNPAMLEMLQTNTPPAGNNVVAVLKGGKPVWYEVGDPILYRALSAIDRPLQSQVVKWLGLPKRVGQLTITLTPDFMMANIARDTIMGSVMSRAGFRPVVDSLNGMRLRITSDPLYKEYLANGGGLSSIFLDENRFRAKLERFYQRQGIDYRTVLDVPAKLLNFVETLADSFEMSTRLGEYARAVARGEHPRHAAYLGREVSTDFAMRGDSNAIGFMYDTVMFLRPAVVSLDRLYRGVAHDPNKGAIAAKTATVAMMSMALYLLNKDDPRYQDLADWDRDANWHFFLGDMHFRYPKIWEIGAVASIAERTAEKVISEDPQGLGKDFARILGNTFHLNLMPQILAPLAEQAANRNSFTNAPIQTPGMENLQPFLRAKPTTSATLQAAGMATRDLPEALQLNPVRAEALLRGYTNTWGAYGLMLADKAFFGDKLPTMRTDQLPVVHRFYSEEPPQHTRFETQFYDMLGEAKRLHGTLRELDHLGRPELADEKEKEPLATEAKPLERAAKSLSGINKDMQAVRRSDATPDEKRQQLDALTVERNALLKAAVTESKAAQTTKEKP